MLYTAFSLQITVTDMQNCLPINHPDTHIYGNTVKLSCLPENCMKCISVICHNSVTTQNLWFFRRDF